MTISLLAAIAAAYLLGAIPFGLLLSRAITGLDPRQHGSGNIGATNALRTGGKMVGALTLLADIIKGVIPVTLAIYSELSEVWIGTIAAATFIGHIYPVYLRFRGGKGVATMLGVMLPWQPWVALAGIVLWYVIMKLSHYVSLASILAAIALPLTIFLTGGSLPALLVGMLIASLVTLKHASNIKRLLDGTESTTRKKEESKA
ncbi:MAG: glycerol-3-phosphate 1-O-acyltransferase PlsY [Mariprofundus sp.]|nr:glycerol-3-phosphate 1-O-acyltransferase PlsY [Mariprofundus sp.]